jgi:uncharacterized protein (TIGR02284 family)
MSIYHDVSKLDDLIVTTIDSIRGYDQAADHAQAGRFEAFFREMADDRRRVIEALTARSLEMGGTPAHYGSVAATLHRRWEDLRRALGGGDGAVLAEIERGEDYLKEEFERVLHDTRMSPGSLGVVQQCHRSVLRGHDGAKSLRDALHAVA